MTQKCKIDRQRTTKADTKTPTTTKTPQIYKNLIKRMRCRKTIYGYQIG